jgi:dTDP-4-dehydrorhamnose 3,5-epimerase
MNRFEITELGLGVRSVTRLALGDARGSLTRLFCAQDLASAGWSKPVTQVNWVENKMRGTLRGLHYQVSPFAEDKLLFCMDGEIHDVVVDVRRGSQSLLQHVAVNLSATRGEGLLIPSGFAHGYQCLSDDVKLLYFHSAPHAPSSERGLNPLDPTLKIAWPLAVENLSERDQKHAFLNMTFEGEQF